MPARSRVLRHRRLRRMAGAMVGAFALVATVAMPLSSAQAGPSVTTYHVDGLHQPVTIDVDTWGVPHIFAQTDSDVFLAQGFNAARDRLFQIDLWRRRGLGQLSEVFGPSYIQEDRAARLFLYRGNMNKEWASYSPDAKQIATEFTNGINAYIDYVEAHPSQLPVEFKMMNYLPAKWQPEDVVRIRTHALVSGLTSEVARAKLVCAGGLDLDPLRTALQPAHTVTVPQGLDPCLPDDVLNVYNLATESVSFTGDPSNPLSFQAADPATDDDPYDDPALQGSNNWAISGSRTATGRPILANDPHRTLETPSLRYIAQLSAPGLDVIGAGEPAVPGISIGHNQSIAFGLTVFGIDAQDLYQYKLNAANTKYWYKGKWVAFQNVPTQINVRGASTQSANLQFTVHGPVIYIDAAKHMGYAVRSTWSQPGTSAYMASLSYMNAQDWQQFTSALQGFGAPGENQVYADIDGNIGWKAAGLAPRRVGYDGLLPVPGDGRYDWNGFVPPSQMPQSFNPAQGFINTSNQYDLPANTPAKDVTSYEWDGPERYQRIFNVLSQNDHSTLQDSANLQNDSTTVRAQGVVSLIQGLQSDDPLTETALNFIRGWDGNEKLGSTQATLYQNYWESRINTAVKDALIPPARQNLISSVDWLVVMDVLQNPTKWLGPNGAATRDQILLSSLRDAYSAAQADLGTDTSAWGYTGNARVMPHPMGTIDPSLNVGPLAIPGSSTSPNAAGNASFREVIDVGDWDNSLAMNTPGQSGDPNSPHYSDLAEPWAEGQTFPLLYSRAAVEAHTETKIILTAG